MARFMAFGLLILKILAFSGQQVVKDQCLSELLYVEVNKEEEKEEKGKRKAKKKTKSLVFSQEEEERVERFCVFALSFYIPSFKTPLVPRPLCGDVQPVQR